MRPKSLVLLILALGCGLVAAVGINQILATPSTDVKTVGIVVAKNEIQKGNVIKPEDIRLQEWHADSVPPGAITNIDDLAERRVKNHVMPGEAILETKLVAKGARDNEVPPGMKAVTVQVDAVTGLSGLVSPGDNVDVVLFQPASQTNKVASTRVLFKNVKVHAIDQDMDRPEAGETAGVAKTVTLVASPKQALSITHASEIGKIRLLARSAKDGDDEGGNDEAITDPFGGGAEATAAAGPSLPTLAAAPADKPGSSFTDGVNSLTDLLREMKNARDTGLPDKPVEQPWKMVLLEGTDAKEMEFSNDSKLPHVAGAKPAAGGDKSGTTIDEGTADEKDPAASKSNEDGFSRLPPIELEIPTESP